MTDDEAQQRKDKVTRRSTARRAVIGGAVAVVLLFAAGLVAGTLGATKSDAVPSATPTATPGPLHPPTGLYVSDASDGSIVVSWQPAQAAAVGYRIYRASTRSGSYTIVGSVSDPNMDAWTDPADGLTTGSTYAYTVTAYSRTGESAPAGPIMVLVQSAPRATPTAQPPAPLPTFAPLTAPTLTAIAKAAKTPVRGQVAVPSVVVPSVAVPSVVVPSAPAGTLFVDPTPLVALPTPLPTLSVSSLPATATPMARR